MLLAALVAAPEAGFFELSSTSVGSDGADKTHSTFDDC